jgi:hypothetical protein
MNKSKKAKGKTQPLKKTAKRKGPSSLMIDRVKKIFTMLEKEQEPVYKSKLKEIGLDSHSAETWIQIIVYIQQQPELIITKAGRHTVIALQRSNNKSE